MKNPFDTFIYTKEEIEEILDKKFLTTHTFIEAEQYNSSQVLKKTPLVKRIHIEIQEKDQSVYAALTSQGIQLENQGVLIGYGLETILTVPYSWKDEALPETFANIHSFKETYRKVATSKRREELKFDKRLVQEFQKNKYDKSIVDQFSSTYTTYWFAKELCEDLEVKPWD